MTNEERETLVDIRKAAETGLSCISCGNDCSQLLWQIVGLCDAALSRPLRNCELYATYAEAAEAHKEYAIADIMRSSRKFYFPMEFDKWLYALAEERKGEGDDK